MSKQEKALCCLIGSVEGLLMWNARHGVSICVQQCVCVSTCVPTVCVLCVCHSVCPHTYQQSISDLINDLHCTAVPR